MTKDAVKFGTTGDIGSANIMCRCAALPAGQHPPGSTRLRMGTAPCWQGAAGACLGVRCSTPLHSLARHASRACLMPGAPCALPFPPSRQNKSVDKPEDVTEIDINEPVALTFALRYLNSFAKVWGAAGACRKGSAAGLGGSCCHWPLAWACLQASERRGPRRCRGAGAAAGVAAEACDVQPTARPARPAMSPARAQATPLSTHVVLKLSKDLPVVVEYHVSAGSGLGGKQWLGRPQGWLCAPVGECCALCRCADPPRRRRRTAQIPDVGRLGFYLAPKVEEEENMEA